MITNRLSHTNANRFFIHSLVKVMFPTYNPFAYYFHRWLQLFSCVVCMHKTALSNNHSCKMASLYSYKKTELPFFFYVILIRIYTIVDFDYNNNNLLFACFITVDYLIYRRLFVDKLKFEYQLNKKLHENVNRQKNFDYIQLNMKIYSIIVN
jgi:hypothetical protein